VFKPFPANPPLGTDFLGMPRRGMSREGPEHFGHGGRGLHPWWCDGADGGGYP